MHFIGAMVGLAVGTIVWFGLSYLVAASIIRVEKRFPHLAGSGGIRLGEATVCGLMFLACLALAFWIARLMWTQ